MYKAKLVKHVVKDMQLTDEKGKVVFKASVDVAVDDYLANIPALTRNIQNVMNESAKLQDAFKTATKEDAFPMLEAMGKFSEELSSYINTYLTTVFGAVKAHELLMACNNRALDAYCAVVPFVDECIAPEINKEINKNMARITDIMK